MTSYLPALRAVSSQYAKRTIKTVSILVAAISFVFIIGTWALATYANAWWWLLLIVFLPLCLLAVIILTVTYLLARLIYQRKLTKSQKKQLNKFVDKLQTVTEQAQFSGIFIVFIICKDILLYRDLRTLQKFIGDSTSLKNDLDALAREIN